jgi:hypothetical protein
MAFNFTARIAVVDLDGPSGVGGSCSLGVSERTAKQNQYEIDDDGAAGDHDKCSVSPYPPFVNVRKTKGGP